MKELKQAILEGCEEARQEMEQEQEQANAEREKALAAIAEIPPRKHLAAAAAAPFRVTVFQDWFSIFKDDDQVDDHLPLHLHTFGEPGVLKEQQEQELREILARDFGISDRDSAMTAAAFFAAPYWNYLAAYEDQKVFAYKEENDRWAEVNKAERIGLTIAILSHLLIGSADLGYISADEAMELLVEPLKSLEEYFTNWVQYGEAVIAGENISKLNNALGRKVLRKFIGYLENKQGSPWKYVSIK